jgi:hypothetical protein
MHNITLVSNLESALDELNIAHANAVCASPAQMAANPESLEWWLTGQLNKLKSAIGKVESVVAASE